MKARWMAVVAVILVGCPKSQPVTEADASTNASADASADAGADADAEASAVDGHALVAGACLSCHSEHMLAQQRLTEAQWEKVVTKMAGWGANLDPTEVAPLVAHLSATYGPDAGDAGDYEAGTITAAEAMAEIAPLPDGLFPAGDAERGKPLFIEKCSACHGQDARGSIGVLLIERPLLYRAAEFAKTVNKGRGKMLPIALSDAEIGDVLAHLRRLRNAPP